MGINSPEVIVMPLQSISTMLFVKDLPRMAAFYESTLQIQATADTADDDGWRVYPVGDGNLALHAIPAQYAEGIEITDPPEVRESSVAKVIFTVQDLDSERRRLSDAGLEEITPAGMRSEDRADYVDPEGNVFQLSRGL